MVDMEMEIGQIQDQEENQIVGELISKSGRKIIPRKFADGEKIFTPMFNCLRKQKVLVDQSSNTTQKSKTITTENDTEIVKKTVDDKIKTYVDAISKQCELCSDFFKGSKLRFLQGWCIAHWAKKRTISFIR